MVSGLCYNHVNEGGMVKLSHGKNRLFIAIPVRNDIREMIGAYCTYLAQEMTFASWVHPRDYHITLKYLGGVDYTHAEQIKPCLKDLAAHITPFHLELVDWKTFGSTLSPSVLWMAVQEYNGLLDQLYKQVEECMSHQGFEPESRKFRPHLTLARQYRGEQSFDQDQLKSLNLARKATLKWTVKEMILYRSVPEREPKYQPLNIYSFNNDSI